MVISSDGIAVEAITHIDFCRNKLYAELFAQKWASVQKIDKTASVALSVTAKEYLLEFKKTLNPHSNSLSEQVIISYNQDHSQFQRMAIGLWNKFYRPIHIILPDEI